MPNDAETNGQPDWYFTAPWDSVPVRRDDALGFRAGADYFADLLAPGLSNAASDARWISLPVEHWHEYIGNPTLADAILDRLVHGAQVLTLKGGSMRKRLAAANDSTPNHPA